jgi:hypothetical protein
MESASPPQKFQKDPCATFIRTDGVLLEVRNRKVECCIWSLVATTSHILALKLTTSWELLIRSIPLLFWVAAWLPLIVLAYHSLWTKCTPWFASIMSHTMAILQPLTILLYWCSCITYFEWVPYMASVHSQAVWSWSQPCAHISILS